MTSDDLDDLSLRRLRSLRIHEPDRSRSERIRARCRARMARRQQTARAADRDTASTPNFETALVSGFGAVYLLAILYQVLRLPGLR